MKLFNRVAIVGTGLIGGSLALAIKKKKLAKEIIGVSRHKKTLLLAKKSHAIDKGSQDANIIKDADLVILATPVNTIIKLAPKIAKVIRKDCIVTDVGSTKQGIVSSLEKLFRNFVGAHPMAGSEKRGIVYAHPGMFKNSLCILTPTKNTNRGSLKKIELLWRKVGAKTLLINPAQHDKILSLISHLPHIAAFSLIDAVPAKYLKFASSGLKDTTRIAASESELWADIFLSNRNNAVKAIEIFQKNLTQIKSAIQKKNRRKLTLILERAKLKRIALG
jgi:prephenate dehydrogenase